MHDRVHYLVLIVLGATLLLWAAFGDVTNTTGARVATGAVALFAIVAGLLCFFFPDPGE